MERCRFGQEWWNGSENQQVSFCDHFGMVDFDGSESGEIKMDYVLFV
jgi:hypothetical protein